MRLSIAQPPNILCIHFQRLRNGSSVGFRARKIDTFVKYSSKFDISPYCSSYLSGDRGNLPIFYALRSVIVHRGGSGGGHYVVYKKEMIASEEEEESSEEEEEEKESSWVLISDNEWRPATENEALSTSAYMLFYERS